jgi:hypothetical protein
MITYINGVEYGRRTIANSSSNGTSPNIIGKRNNGDAYMTGELGEISIFGSPLTPGQVTDLYSSKTSVYV